MERLFERDGAVGTEQRRTIQMFRLAGLLHDIGHYPYSHATQDAIEKHYKYQLLLSNGEQGDAEKDAGVALAHEDVGRLILENDPEMQAALRRGPFNIEPRDIGLLFRRDEFKPFSNILSSDLDADRMDHITRTSHFAGLPYGPVDLDYIVSQVCADDKNHAVLTRRAIRAADHLLLCRIFDYRQVAKHRTVAGFEWLLQDVLMGLLDASPDLRWDKPGIRDMVKDGRWAKFTDSYMFELIQAKLDPNCEERFKKMVAEQKAQALLSRRVPKMVGEIERYALRKTPGEQDQYTEQRAALESARTQWAKEFNLDADLWAVLPKQIKITEMGADFLDEEDVAENTLRLVAHHRGPSLTLNSQPQSLLSVLSKYNLDLIRIYVLLPDTKDADKLKDQIRQKIRADFHEYEWS